MAGSHDDGISQASSVPRRLWFLGIAGLLAYAVLAGLSFAFHPDNPHPPLLASLTVLALATLCYWFALGCVFRRGQEENACWLRVVLGFSVAYRLLLLPSVPIQEIDFYRYLWDGRVTLHGFNPYHFSPFQVEDSGPLATPSSEIAALWQLGRQSASVQAIFESVHHRGVPTVYPPAAQLVFAVGALVPATAPVWVHVLVLKTILVGFDVATLFLLVALLRRLSLPPAWCLVYGWCPLVLKEFANSGHLDSIAVFFTTLAMMFLVRLARPAENKLDRSPVTLSGAAMISLALGVLAKSYPIVLLPVVAAYLLARLRQRALLPLAAFGVVVVGGYLPFVDFGRSALAGETQLSRSQEAEPTGSPELIGRPDLVSLEPNTPGTGLTTFLSQWEMNDLLFMLVRENLHAGDSRPAPWFVVVPETWRRALSEDVLIPLLGDYLPPTADPTLLLAQVVMGGVLGFLCLVWAWNSYRRPEPLVLLRCIFLTLAWAWLLASAQNPWYLVWCLPFMVFAGRASWFLLPGLVLLYYARFWIEARMPGNVDIFDYGLVWLEYMPFFVALAIETWSPLVRRLRLSTDERDHAQPQPLNWGA